MNTKMPVGLIIISIIAILIDCYAGYVLFLMLAMPMARSLPPLVPLTIVLGVIALFIASTINLFRFRKWAYRVFFALTGVFTLFWTSMYIYISLRGLIKKNFVVEAQQVFLIVFFLTFLIYFLRPSIRRLFK